MICSAIDILTLQKTAVKPINVDLRYPIQTYPSPLSKTRISLVIHEKLHSISFFPFVNLTDESKMDMLSALLNAKQLESIEAGTGSCGPTKYMYRLLYRSRVSNSLKKLSISYFGFTESELARLGKAIAVTKVLNHFQMSGCYVYSGKKDFSSIVTNLWPVKTLSPFTGDITLGEAAGLRKLVEDKKCKVEMFYLSLYSKIQVKCIASTLEKSKTRCNSCLFAYVEATMDRVYLKKIMNSSFSYSVKKSLRKLQHKQDA